MRIRGRVEVHHTFDPIIVIVRQAEHPRRAHSARLIIGGTMSGQVTVDTTNETATLEFLDDRGDTNAPPPDGAVITFTSSDESVATIVPNGTNPLQGDITPVAEGTADIGATIADGAGNPILEPDGVTLFAVSPVTVTVGPGAAVGAALVLSV